jgi:hypothetical protein
MAEELGLEPGPALQELQQAILRQDAGLVPAAPEPRARRRLPAPETPLVGRAAGWPSSRSWCAAARGW